MTDLSSSSLRSEAQKPTGNSPPPPPTDPGHVTISLTPPSPTPPSAAAATNTRKISLLPLIFLIFYEVSGGPFGIEDTVKAAGPLLAILGLILFPFVWSIPEALITAEMSTMFPENGGYVVWVSSALGPYWGFQQGWVKWLSGVIDNALYPILFLDYLQSGLPVISRGLPRVASVIALTFALTYLSYRGLSIVGVAAVVIGVFSILPFVVMCLVSIPKVEPLRWLVVSGKFKGVDFSLYLNTLFWNLNYWDSISTLSGEVGEPRGGWLGWWILAAAAASNMGMFLAEMSSDSFQLLGMAERGMLPEVFARRSRYGTPWVGILFSASGVVVLSWLSFQEIVAAENLLYCFGMVLEFIAFVRLRVKHADLLRYL
ncbi:hypothetical protein Bca52824_069737 [Brassica carinata]|uniref:Uncharacterized protein n=1 Tax=Brassica carinata TaxID=52824 RepID=A0A8X7Q458_BRACI|nr:hypothetical protein Bca52824_069737 [Brassica carinata]